MRLRKAGLFVLILMGLVGWVAAGQAASLQVGDWVRIRDLPGGPGGQFGIDIEKNGIGGYDFVSFCLELNETITIGGRYQVSNISNAAIQGGINGGSPDPLSGATTYVFSWFNGLGSLLDADHANAVQYVIWYLEGELTDEQFNALMAGTSQTIVTGAGFSVFLSGLVGTMQGWAQNLYNDAITAQNSGYYNSGVRVVNLIDANGNQRQSMGIVPEPGVLALLGLGLVSLAVWRRKEHS